MTSRLTIAFSVAFGTLACSAHPSSEATLGRLRVPLPPGATVVADAEQRAQGDSLTLALDERMTLTLTLLPSSAETLQQIVDSVIQTRNALTSDTDWRLESATDSSLQGRVALILHPPCGDCEAIEVYSEVGGQRFVAAWGVDGLGSRPMAERHRAGFALVASIHP